MTPDPVPPSIESPCIKVCVLDARNVCIGCGRTIDEIADWSRMTAEQRHSTIERAAQRRQARESVER